MKKIVEFLFESNVMTGGVKTNNNFLVSRDYISGAVLRAGFANDILLDCKFYNTEVDGKKHFVKYRGSECDGCSNVNVCKNFSDMYFSFLFPLDTVYAPLTMKVCKAYGTKHSVKDVIWDIEGLKCSECDDGNGRMEDMKGFIKDKTLEEYKVERSISTHTSINYSTRTAKSGSLFQIDAIKRGETFWGIIDDKGSNLLEIGKTIYIGKYSSNGFGKIKITKISDYKTKDIKNRIDKFNKKFSLDKNKLYASILFLSDAKIFEQQLTSEPLTTEDYKSQWKQCIFGDCDIFKIEKVFAQNFLYGGYDTSRTENNWQKEPEVHTQMGSSILVSFDKSQEGKAIEALKAIEDDGIGEDINAGFGQVEVCNELHMIGVNGND